MTTDRIETLRDEQRRFKPPAAFRAQAHVQDTSLYERARRDPEGYWADWAKQLAWIRPWDRVLDWKPPHAQWFVGGKLNASVNCLDRHIRAGRSDRVARVAIYLPMVPEVAVAMLACARIGAVHTVVFGGFSAESLGDRINDAGAKLLIFPASRRCCWMAKGRK